MFCVTNSDGDSKALKLYNATVFMCKLYNPLTNYQRDCIYSAFEGRVEGIYFRCVHLHCKCIRMHVE